MLSYVILVACLGEKGRERNPSSSSQATERTTSSAGGRERRVSSESKCSTSDRKKSVFSKINEDWNNFLRDIGSASTMNQHENVM